MAGPALVKTMIDIISTYRNLCAEHGVQFVIADSPRSYDASTLFCPAGMQQFKDKFSDESLTGQTVANIQPCIRLTDMDCAGDGTHALLFHMIGLFSFRDWPLEKAIWFFHEFVNRCGIGLTRVTVHPDYQHWSAYHPKEIHVDLDEGCRWSDGVIGGYCTEFYSGDLEIGNVVNPLGTCIDVGFGLERMQKALDPSLTETKAETLAKAALAIIASGVRPSNKQHGYVLRKILRSLGRAGGSIDHVFFREESEKRQRTVNKYYRLLPAHGDKPRVWWWDTHGIDIDNDL